MARGSRDRLALCSVIAASLWALLAIDLLAMPRRALDRSAIAASLLGTLGPNHHGTMPISVFRTPRGIDVITPWQGDATADQSTREAPLAVGIFVGRARHGLWAPTQEVESISLFSDPPLSAAEINQVLEVARTACDEPELRDREMAQLYASLYDARLVRQASETPGHAWASRSRTLVGGYAHDALTLAILLGAVGFTDAVRRSSRALIRERRLARSECPSCRYALRGLTDRTRCPECGAALEPSTRALD